MIKFLPEQSWLRVLFLSTMFCFAFLMIRNVVENNQTYNFLIWNLFLGFLPFVVVYFMQFWVPGRSIIWWIIGLFTWLVFYPNAPYMITDLIHVDAQEKDVIYDTLMIFSFSILSLFYGFYSLKIANGLLMLRLSASVSRILIYFSVLLSSFGIYLGRILRLNSWDIVTHPWETIVSIWEHLIPISENPVTYVIIILFTIIQVILLSLIQELDLHPNLKTHTHA